MRELGDALALAGWGALFDAGLIIDPRRIMAAMAQRTIENGLAVYPSDSGSYALFAAEFCWRSGKLAREWEWRTAGVGVGQVSIVPVRGLPHDRWVYSRDACGAHAGAR
jgi:hypothetical protein